MIWDKGLGIRNGGLGIRIGYWIFRIRDVCLGRMSGWGGCRVCVLVRRGWLGGEFVMLRMVSG